MSEKCPHCEISKFIVDKLGAEDRDTIIAALVACLGDAIAGLGPLEKVELLQEVVNRASRMEGVPNMMDTHGQRPN